MMIILKMPGIFREKCRPHKIGINKILLFIGNQP